MYESQNWLRLRYAGTAPRIIISKATTTTATSRNIWMCVCLNNYICLWLSRLLNLLLARLQAAPTANMAQFFVVVQLVGKSSRYPYGIFHSHPIAVTVTVQVLSTLSLSQGSAQTLIHC